MNSFQNIFSNLQLYLQPLLSIFSTKRKPCVNKQKYSPELPNQLQLCFDIRGPDNEDDIIKLSRGEIKMVMDRLGITSDDSEYEYSDEESLGSEEILELFEEKEPSLEEVKGAFDVFDENRDGFIDAEDLQRVLCSLGLIEGSEVEQCKEMISSVNENGDGFIDFDEFVKFMDKVLLLIEP